MWDDCVMRDTGREKEWIDGKVREFRDLAKYACYEAENKLRQ